MDEFSGGFDELEHREPNPDAGELHLAYDSVYTHEGDTREELLEKWVSQSNAGKRWRCWKCENTSQRFSQLRFPTFRTVISICDNCSMWTVWEAWRDIANPRIFNLRRALESETAPVDAMRPPAGDHSADQNGSEALTVAPAV
ncbi:MAG: hypothetical protein ACRDF8_06690, partial [Chloroflexota bacterium]